MKKQKYASWWTSRGTKSLLGDKLAAEVESVWPAWKGQQLGNVIDKMKTHGRGDLATRIKRQVEEHNRDVFSASIGWREYEDTEFVNEVGESGVTWSTWEKALEEDSCL